MIISASRRTDIPAFYFDWFVNRLREGYALVRNPMNRNQLSRISLGRETAECIVFWSKNPAPMLPLLDRLDGYPFYVQFTLNPYGYDMEGELPETLCTPGCPVPRRTLPGKGELLDTFRRLADAIGPERVVWRYSPALFNAGYTREFHLEHFSRFAEALRGYTRQCKLSFLDIYPKIRKSMTECGIFSQNAGPGAPASPAEQLPPEQRLRLAREFQAIAAACGIGTGACADAYLARAGFPAANCVDRELIEQITGKKLRIRKDPNQRAECLCVESADIGAYDTCLHACRYCYANRSIGAALAGMRGYDPDSPLLCGHPGPDDKISERKVKMHALAAKKQPGQQQLMLY